MRIKLSNRLQAVARQIPAGRRVADIGTDHGYLPVFLAVNDISPQIIASDLGKGPLAQAEQLVGLLSLENQISCRLGDGLSVLVPGEADVICIAGMGGMAITEIIAEGMVQAKAAGRLVLQPQRNVAAVRRFLADNGFRIVAEDLAEDDGFYYEIIAAEPGEMQLSDLEAEFGPLLLSCGHPLLEGFLNLRERDLTRLLESMSENNSAGSCKRKMQLEEEISRVAKVIAGINAKTAREGEL
ncbi:MAG TPA: SAM-dependent methyltransferase [Candidatus Avidehalobacter gallistercoris]|uniref:SAM-dependent methyltransferase n=1 Tax=Candidatus Avidehalobacter gallistercoris TaxID=2840694 RepID=A0A9D1HKB3_9FIRM|nr:SAM-dependent methyltransferase [Candidatus Avidehalobacter gallistercoris]